MKMQVDVNSLDQYDVYSMYLQYAPNFTMRCDATSRRGWFELENYQNGFAHQPMLETWPTSQEMKNKFNDINTTLGPVYWPVEE